MIYTYGYKSPLGKITLAGSEDGLSGLWFENQKYFGKGLPENHEEKRLSVFDMTIRWLDVYFAGSVPDFTPPLCLKGTDFRREIWDILLCVPYGKTITYGEIARITARRKGLEKMSAQAVGGAVGQNPVSIIIPCHRVVGSDGSLTGYAGGTDKKLLLLRLEKAKFNGIAY